MIGLYKEISYLRARSLRIDSLERVPVILCGFMKTFTGVFIYCFPMKKKQETYIGLKFDFFFKLYGWRHPTMKYLQYSIPFSPQE